MPQLLLGFAGEIASGKGTATRLIKEWFPGTMSARFSDPLREFTAWFASTDKQFSFKHLETNEYYALVENMLCRCFGLNQFPRPCLVDESKEIADTILARWGGGILPRLQERGELQFLSTLVRQKISEDILERSIVARMAGSLGSSPVGVIEGIRREVDISNLLLRPDFKLIYIDVDPRIAFERMKLRNENAGDHEMTREEFERRRLAEAESQIRSLKARAHILIDNSGIPGSLESELRRAVMMWLRSCLP
jgi:dephospho-CoA kinase